MIMQTLAIDSSITRLHFMGELEGNWLNFKTYHRAFASYDCARKWAANVLYRNRKYRGVKIEME